MRYNVKDKVLLIYIIFFVFGGQKGIAQASKNSVIYALKQYKKHAYVKNDSAVYYLQKAKFAAMGNHDSLVTVYGQTSDYYAFVGDDSDAALGYLNKAIKLRPKIKDTILIAQIYNRKGYVLKMQWKFEEALLCYNKAIAMLESTEKYKLLYNSYTKKGKLYTSVGLFTEAFASFDKALQLAKKDTKVSESFIYRSIGQAHKAKGEYEEAEVYFEKAIEIIQKRKNSKKNQAEYIRNNTSLAQLAYEKGNYKKALELALKSEKWIKEVKKKKSIIGLHLLMGKLYYALGNDSLALYFTEKSYLKAIKKNVGKNKIASAKQLSLIYQRQRNFDKAHEFLERYNTMKAFYAKEEAKYSLMKGVFLETINEQNEKLALVNKSLKNEKSYTVVIGILCIGLLLIIYLFYKRKKYKLLQQLQKSKTTNTRIKENLVVAQRKTLHTQNELDAYTRLLSQQTNLGSETEFLHVKPIMQQLLDLKILTEEDWLTFKSLFLNIYPDFYKNFKVNVSDYSLGDLKLASLIRLNFNTKEIAKILAISPESVRKGKYRLRKKMTFASEKELQKFIYTL